MRSIVTLALSMLLLVPVAQAGPADDPVGTAQAAYGEAIAYAGGVIKFVQNFCDNAELGPAVTDERREDPLPDLPLMDAFWDSWQGLPCLDDNGIEPWCANIQVGAELRTS